MTDPTKIFILEVQESAHTAHQLEERFRQRVKDFAVAEGAIVTLQQNGTVRRSGESGDAPIYTGTRTYQVELPSDALEVAPEPTPEPEPQADPEP